MQIVIVGYGKMGILLEIIAQQKGIEVVSIINDSSQLKSRTLPDSVVLIDFSTSEAFLQNLEIYIQNKYKFVVGTTGWYDNFEIVKNKVIEAGVSCCYGANFSIIMHQFNKLVDFATSQLEKFDNIHILIEETHHTSKKDSPSGTALELKNIINKNSKKHVEITSHRVGDVIGEHKVFYEDNSESIQLVHSSKSKNCYIEGALLCAEYLKKHAGIFSAKQIFDEIL
jgi:4-hydroxy-tetrahydrodipicolinate reductase